MRYVHQKHSSLMYMSLDKPVIFMDLNMDSNPIGRIYASLDREVFPEGVDNFVGMVRGDTHKISKTSKDLYQQHQRSFNNTSFFKVKYNNYMVGGDIYNDDGSSAGTIFDDEPLPAPDTVLYYTHDVKGIISLVPYRDDVTGDLMYDSTFMITLDSPKSTNLISELDTDQIVIGSIYSGLEVLDKINMAHVPFAGRKYPRIKITRVGINAVRK